jgi:hypothetical protein
MGAVESHDTIDRTTRRLGRNADDNHDLAIDFG